MANGQVDAEQIELDLDLEDIAAYVDIAGDELFAHYVVYPLRLASYGSLFLRAVIDTITFSSTISPTAWYAVDFKPPSPFNRQQLRILVNFLSKDDSVAFTNVKFISVTLPGGKLHKLEIVQDAAVYGELSSSSTPMILVKDFPDTWTLPQIRAILTGVRKSTSTAFIPHLEDLQWMLHRGGNTPRKLLIGTATPIESDPDFALLPSVINVGHGKQLLLGCTRHYCIYCDDTGHRSKVHDRFIRVDNKRKRDKPPTKEKQIVLDDPLLTLPLLSKNKETWKCSTCVNASLRPIGGNGFHGALEHIKTSQHQENVEKLEKTHTNYLSSTHVDNMERTISSLLREMDKTEEDILSDTSHSHN